MTMRLKISFFILYIVMIGFSTQAHAQAMKSLLEERAAKQEKSQPMKSLKFKKAEKTEEEKAAEEFEELDEEKMTEEELKDGEVMEIPAQKKISYGDTPPPEEDVWEKYKSLAAGSNNKPMGRQMMRKDIEDDAEEEIEEEPESKQTKKLKEDKGFLPNLLEDYKKKRSDNGGFHSRSLNE